MAVYYVSTTGSNGNPGTIGSPFLTIEHLETVMVAGDTAYIRGGTYTSPRPLTDEYLIWIQGIVGTSGSPCRIENYPGETVVIDYSYINPATTTNAIYGLYFQNCNYLTVKGIRVTGIAQPTTGDGVTGFTLDNCDNCTIELCEVDALGGYGFVIFNSDNNLILNCDAHHLGDNITGWGGANGFGITGDVNTSTGNTFRGCRAWGNSDDGFDFFASRGLATMENCWAFKNGWQPGTSTIAGDGAGFKLGRGYDNGGAYPQNTTTILRVLRNCLAFENRFTGFDENVNVNLQFPSQLDNCTAWQNGTNNTVSGYAYANGYNYTFYSTRINILRNCASHTGTVSINAESTETTNSWNGGVTVSDADFDSLVSTGSDGARQIDGSLPELTFLHLSPGSDLIDAGTDIGLPFNGLAPDLGAFESGSAPAVLNNSFFINMLRMGVIGSGRATSLPVSSPNISRIQSKSGKNNSVTFDSTPVAGNTVVIGVLQLFESYPLLANVTDNQGNVYVLTGQATDGGSDGTQVSLYHKIGVASSGTFTVSISGINNYDRIFIMEYENIGSFDQAVSGDNNASTTVSPGSITPAEADELMIILSCNDETGTGTLTVTPASGFTEVLMANDGSSETTGFLLDRVVSPSGVVTPSSTINHTLNSTTIVAAFKKI